LRDETERVELVEAGANCISGWEADTIYEAYRAMSNRKAGLKKNHTVTTKLEPTSWLQLRDIRHRAAVGPLYGFKI
jgi:hypothetical protein